MQANSQTIITSSPKRIKINESTTNDAETVKCDDIKTLEQLKDINEHQYVSVTGKVTSLYLLRKSQSNQPEMNCEKETYLSHQTAVYRCVAWESDIDILQKNKTYRIANATIRTFNGEKYMSIGEKFNITMILDIGEVIEDEIPQGASGRAKVVKSEKNYHS